MDSPSTQLAIESIGKSASLAVMKGESLLWERELASQRSTAAELAIYLRRALDYCDSNHHKLDWVSVAAGPGSFTGIRIGITTAKSLAYALSIPVVPVGSLASIAMATGQRLPVGAHLIVGLNAYRGQVYFSQFASNELSIQSDADGKTENGLELDLAEIACRATVIPRDSWDQKVDSPPSDHDESPCIATGDPTLFQGERYEAFVPHSHTWAYGVGAMAWRFGSIRQPTECLSGRSDGQSELSQAERG